MDKLTASPHLPSNSSMYHVRHKYEIVARCCCKNYVNAFIPCKRTFIWWLNKFRFSPIILQYDL